MNPANSVEEIAREKAEEVYLIGNRLTGFATKKDEIASVIADALRAEREELSKLAEAYVNLPNLFKVEIADLRAQLVAERERGESDRKRLVWLLEQLKKADNQLVAERERGESDRKRLENLQIIVRRALDDFVYLEAQFKGSFYATPTGYVLKPRVLEMIDAVAMLPTKPEVGE